MNGYLIPESHMAGIQKMVERGMRTPLIIRRRSVQFLGQTLQSNDLGDDVVTFSSTKDNGTTRKAMGWFWSSPVPMQDDDSGALVTTNTYRLYVPVSTDIQPGDEVLVGAQEYIVSDTTTESTWKPFLRCTLRRRE